MHLNPEALHAARVAMLQAAINAYYADVADSGDFTLTIEVTRDPDEAAVVIDCRHEVQGIPVTGYSL